MKTNATKTNDETLVRQIRAQMKTNVTDEATQQFVGVVTEIRTLLETLTEIADEHFDLGPDEIHWGHVGDVTLTRDALQNIVDRINGTGEYAL